MTVIRQANRENKFEIRLYIMIKGYSTLKTIAKAKLETLAKVAVTFPVWIVVAPSMMQVWQVLARFPDGEGGASSLLEEWVNKSGCKPPSTTQNLERTVMSLGFPSQSQEDTISGTKIAAAPDKLNPTQEPRSGAQPRRLAELIAFWLSQEGVLHRMTLQAKKSWSRPG